MAAGRLVGAPIQRKLTRMSERIEQSFSVGYRYSVTMSADVFAPSNATLAQTLTAAPGRARLLFVLDDGLKRAQPPLPDAIGRYAQAHALELAAPIVTVTGGEAAKNDGAALAQLHRAIDQARLCRHSYVVVIGGGAVLDVAGFAAATAHRGVRLVRLPSTVLAQCDAGVGVKNGINAFGKKNFLGTFAPPHAVINDISLLRTLSDRDWRAGMAEAVKVALIKDATFFEFLETAADDLARRDLSLMAQVIRRCAELHLRHIAHGGDPFEQGSSRPLDFGHWAAHKLEQLSDYRLRHGEAVAIGIAIDTVYSHLSGLISRDTAERVLALLAQLGFALYVDELQARGDAPSDRPLLRGLAEFREHLGGALCVTLLADIGRGVEVHAMDPAQVEAAVDWLHRYSSRSNGRRAPRSLAGGG